MFFLDATANTCPAFLTDGGWALLLGLALAMIISLFGLLIYALLMHYVCPHMTIHDRLIRWLDNHQIR